MIGVRSWDIFCTVVDNYGDIGVCWRLARQLADEHGLQVRLWVDDLASFSRIQPQIDPLREEQVCSGVEVRHWGDSFTSVIPADVVIEAFACNLPTDYLAAMRQKMPLWLNLEYLSAEDWVEGCHGLLSPQAGLAKYFFFPGFTAKTGGLLAEAKMRAARACWSDDDARAFLAQYAKVDPAARRISLFAYENPALPDLLAAWQQGERPVHVFLPEGRLLPLVRAALSAPELAPGASLRRGALSLTCLPMLPQDDYDRLLWSCDLNFVRGEDSFVRAQWAARPFVWHIYPQDDDAHHVKLLAFMSRYCAGLDAGAVQALQDLWLAWNKGDDAACFWPAWQACQSAFEAHARRWSDRLNENGDLASNLFKFVIGKVE